MDEMKPIIELFSTEMRTAVDNGIMKAVYDVDVRVNKERLLKALTDARSFYEEGYEAGKKDRVPHGRWLRKDRDYYTTHVCSACGADYMTMMFNFCPNCGARMDGDKDGS